MSDKPLARTREVSNIELCDHCNGTGVLQREELVNYHKGEYDVWTEKCTRCDGSGLIKRTITTIETVEPYTPQKPRDRK